LFTHGFKFADGKFGLISAPKNLALAYTKAHIRPFISLLLEFDERLGLVIKKRNEALVGQMRMAWWRDVIAKDIASRPSGEPLIARLAIVEGQYGSEHISTALHNIIDAWDMLLAQEEWTADIQAAHADLRSKAIFGAVTQLMQIEESTDAEIWGRKWALYDLANISGVKPDAGVLDLPMPVKLPRNLRPLSLLFYAARQQYRGAGQLAGVRLVLHGLTGR